MEITFCLSGFFLIAAGLWVVGKKNWPNYFEITYVPFLNNQVGSFVFVVAVLLIPLLGCGAGFLLLPGITSVFEASEEGWVLLEKPPQEIQRLRAAKFHTVYAETIDKRLIACYYASAYDKDCWREVSQIPAITEYKCYGRTGGTFPEPPLSVHVIDRIDLEDCMTFAGMGGDRSTVSYVLSDESQVYQNIYGSPTIFPPPGLIRMECLFSVIGLIIGLLIVFGVMTVNKRRNTLKKSSG